jgi:NAD dependent epimerase/dehydratase family enzyme
MATVLLDGQRALPQRLQECGFTFTYPTLEEALRNLLG